MTFKNNSLFLILSCLMFFSNVHADSVKPIIEGNPEAKISVIMYDKLFECGGTEATFFQDSCDFFIQNIYPQIKNEFIDPGIISFEIRPHMLFDPSDLHVARITHCSNDGKSDIYHLLRKYGNEWRDSYRVLREMDRKLKGILSNLLSNQQYDSCSYDKKLSNHIENSFKEGSEKYILDINPTIIINGEKFSNDNHFWYGYNFDEIKNKINSLR